MSALLPEGITHLGDCPYSLHNAILTALRLLSYEEFPKDERPPREIWMDGEKLEEWWKQVDRVREERYGTKTTTDESDWQVNDVSLVSRG